MRRRKALHAERNPSAVVPNRFSQHTWTDVPARMFYTYHVVDMREKRLNPVMMMIY